MYLWYTCIFYFCWCFYVFIGNKASEGMVEVAKMGPIGLDQAILQSIDKCGQFLCFNVTPYMVHA